ncbi:phage tail protein [Pantoea rodasii]|nr:phage tail protein [Pantoea rodasii]
MTGLIDDINHAVLRGQHILTLTGRDEAAVLVDCSAPVFTRQEMTLAEVVEKVVRPLGISRIDIRAVTPAAPKKFAVDPGETAWSALMKVCEVSGLWPWFAPDGTLVLGGPDYSAAPVASLVMSRNGTGNLLDLTKHTSIAGRYSEVTVLAQGHATTGHNGVRNHKGTVRDSSFTLYRPHIEVLGDTDTDEEAAARARKLLTDSRLKALTITAVVRGVRTPGGITWMPGQRVAVKSAIHNIDAIYFIMGREVRGGRGVPLTTTLTLKEDGVWIPDAYPRSRHKKKGKSQAATYHTWEEIP